MNILDSILSEIQDAKQKLSTLQQPVPVQPPEIIDTKELCLRLGISEPTAIKMRRKQLPHFKLGNSIRYNWISVVNYLEKKSKK